MDSSRMGRRGRDPDAETNAMIYNRLKEELKSKTYGEKNEQLEKLKKELEESIAKDTELLVRAWTNPELSDLQIKIAKSNWGIDAVEREFGILKKMKEFNELFSQFLYDDLKYEGFRRFVEAIENIENAPRGADVNNVREVMEALLQMAGVEDATVVVRNR